MVKISGALVLLISLFLIVAGCVSSGSRGRLMPQSGPGETVTSKQLKETWQNYRVLAAGVKSIEPSAILFDRKDDDRKVIGERWWELKDYKAVSQTISWIETDRAIGPYYPRVWKMVGPDGHLYGYMITAWDQAVMLVEDDKTMRVMDLPVPPGRIGDGDMPIRGTD